MTRQLLPLLCLLVAFEATAAAQASPNGPTITSFDPDDAVAPGATTVEGIGWRVGESTVLHPVIGLETGIVSNVFYTSSNPTAAGVLRLIAQLGTGTPTGTRSSPVEGGGPSLGYFNYRASVRASYDQMISGNSAASGTGGLGVGADLVGNINPMGSLSLGYSEDYARLIRAANFETSTDVNRDVNNIDLTLLYHPPDRSLSGALYLDNTVDIFESSGNGFADRMSTRLGVRPAWRWLPQTTIRADISEGVTTGIDSTPGVPNKVTSFPLVATLGLATLLTVNTTLNFSGGYTNGFYDSGPSYSAFVADADFGYRYSPFGRIVLSYNLLYQDSINANYYRDHVFRVWWQHAVGPFQIMAQPELHLREYQGITLVMGPPVRDDVIYAFVGGVHYALRSSLAATLDYRFSAVQTDYKYMLGAAMVDPSYVRHEVLLGVRWAM